MEEFFKMAWVGWLLILTGAVFYALVMFKWEWVSRSYRVRILIRMTSEPAARIIYSVSSVVLITLGILYATGVLG